MKSRLFCVFLILAFSTPTFSQTDTLSWNEFKKIIVSYHPMVGKANLTGDLAKARLKQAWGNFEPKVSYSYDHKQYNDIDYYKFSTPELKLPLWYGLELKGSYAEANGQYLNPESKLPKEGLSYVGLNLSLGKGLLIDKRRASVKQAKIFSEASANEQLLAINNVFYEAGEAYLNWQNQYKITKIYEEALVLSTTRYNAVKAGLSGGDKAAIDTVEALTLVQQREIQLHQAELNLRYAFYEISSFLWLPNNQPIDPQKLNILPQKDLLTLPVDLDTSLNNNPKLINYVFKLQDLEIERRLKAENLRPTIDLQLGILNSGKNAFRNLNPLYFQNNNKVGINISFPLTFASARGELAEAKIKLQNTRLDESVMRNDLKIKLNQNNAENATLSTQIKLIQQNLLASQKLLAAEEMRFRFGDSSLFLINARESKLLEIQEKLFETENKIEKNKLKAAWIMGGLTE